MVHAMPFLPKRRIAVVGPVLGGSIPMAQFAARGMSALGHDVTLIEARPFGGAIEAIATMDAPEVAKDALRGQVVLLAGHFVMDRIIAAKPDLVVYLAQAPVTQGDTELLRSAQIPSVMWFVEDFRVMPYWHKMAGWFDHFWTIQRGPFENALREAGQKNVLYVPCGIDPSVHRSRSAEEAAPYRGRLSFAGSGYPNRHQFLEALLELEPRIYGTHWSSNAALAASVKEEGFLSSDTLSKIFSGSEISLNLYSSPGEDALASPKDFVNPRTFEICGCGGFQLLDKSAPVSEFFEPGKELAVFASIEEAKYKIRYYLTNPSERLAIAEAGQKRAHAEHTYEQRFGAALERLAELDPRLLQRHW